MNCGEKEMVKMTHPGVVHLTREEALALLSLCMLAPNQGDRAAEQGLVKLARACREVLAHDDDLKSAQR